ncbi:MAG: cyclic nucleotide-binding domain-containing protein [Magnetospirillum sp. WYHS-4]
MEKREIRPGERLFREGEPGIEAYIIESGRIEISKRIGEDETAVVAIVGKGEMIGEMALVDDFPRSATARVVEPTTVIVVPRADFEQRLSKSDMVVRRVLQILARRLRDQTDISARAKTIVR